MYALDPELLVAASDLLRIRYDDLPATRAEQLSRIRAAGRVPLRGVSVREHAVTSSDGVQVALRLYLPERRRSRGVVYQLHGGGFILGSLETNHRRNAELAVELGACVASIDYRLAPEWRYPTPLDDAYSGVEWLVAHADQLDIDPRALIVHGNSAGANLAAAVALRARDRGGPAIRLQFLACPVLDNTLETASARHFTDTPALTRDDVAFCWSQYLGADFAAFDDPYAVPARADLAGLPEAYVSAAEFDPLRDDAIEYARALGAAGVRVELHLFPGAFHGSAAVASAAVSRRQRAEEAAVLDRVLRESPAGEHTQ